MVGVDMRFDYFWTSVTKFTLLILFSAHWAGCIYFLLARLRDFGPGTVRPFALFVALTKSRIFFSTLGGDLI